VTGAPAPTGTRIPAVPAVVITLATVELRATHRSYDPAVKGKTSFTFVTDGIRAGTMLFYNHWFSSA
jgi:hypothetical protein